MRRAALILSGLFPTALLVHSAAYFYLPLFLPVVTAAIVATVGFAATGLLIWSARQEPRRIAVAALVVIVTWCTWILVQNRELGLYVRFAIEYSKYEQEVAQIAGGKDPACLQSHECESDGLGSPYVIFPYPGLLTAWPGVLHVSDPQAKEPNLDRLKAFAAAAACDPIPLVRQYFICVFY